MECNENIYERTVGLAKNMNKGNSYKHSNFLLAEKATELEVEIIWTENNEGRPLNETFIFLRNECLKWHVSTRALFLSPFKINK
ncbi:hypothetical protein ACTHO5_27855 [Cytobacillus praedii]|uniref:hypothetical protein n=1 Tax=Cytobacillus praedii TaxID=1742358 RepID=UPI003F820361